MADGCRYRWNNKEDMRAERRMDRLHRPHHCCVQRRRGRNYRGEQDSTAAKVSAAVKHALNFVEPYATSMDEPYLIAAYALAALDSGQEARAAAALKRLRHLEHREGNTSYWTLEMNTPFYGWGYTGRLETTALVVEALEKGETAHGRAPWPTTWFRAACSSS